MLSLMNHLTAFWTVVVMNCVQPVNWEACLPVHEWLLPEVTQGYKLWTGQIHPYDDENKYLN